MASGVHLRQHRKEKNMAFNPMGFMAGLPGALGGIFGMGGGDPYADAMKQYQKYADQAAGYQNPFFEAGSGAIGDYQDYLQRMQDPSAYLNQLMGDYQESGYNKYLQDEAARAGLNAASAGGLVGSTPYMQEAERTAANLAQGGMDNWLKQALGLNELYGSGLDTLMGRGQGASNALTNLYGGLGKSMGLGTYGQGMDKRQQMGDLFGGLGSLAMLAFL